MSQAGNWSNRQVQISPMWVFVALTLLCVLMWVGAGWATVAELLLIDGARLAVWLAGAWGLGLIARRAIGIRCDALADRWLIRLTDIGLGVGLLSLLTLGLGLAGVLNAWIAWAMLLVPAIAAAIICCRANNTITEKPAKNAGDWIILLLVPAAAVLVVATLIPPGLLWGDEPHGYDVLSYHLQLPREWYELGRIVPLHHNVFSCFPLGSEMHSLLAMHLAGGPWKAMYLSQMMVAAQMVLAIAVIFAAVASRDRAGAPVAAALAGAVPSVVLVGAVAYNESTLLLFTTLAVAWLVRLVSNAGAGWRSAVLAGAFIGFACGTKYTAVPLLMIGAPFALALAAWAGRLGRGWWLRSSLIVGVVALLLFSPWLVRNLAWTGNPVFPQATQLLGRGHFSEMQEQRWIVAHGAAGGDRGIVDRVTALIKEVVLDWRYGFVVLPLALATVFVRRSWWRDPSVVLLLGLLLVLTVFWLTLTHLQSRFFITAVPLAALLLVGLPAVWRFGAAVAVFAAVMVGMGLNNDSQQGLASRVHRWVQVDWATRADDPTAAEALIGMSNLALLRSPVADAIDPARHLSLAGDARAYVYDRPIDTFSYRTVFDVNAQPGQSSIEAWLNGTPEGAAVLVSPSELDRFNRTYKGIPPLPAGADPHGMPYRAE